MNFIRRPKKYIKDVDTSIDSFHIFVDSWKFAISEFTYLSLIKTYACTIFLFGKDMIKDKIFYLRSKFKYLFLSKSVEITWPCFLFLKNKACVLCGALGRAAPVGRFEP